MMAIRACVAILAYAILTFGSALPCLAQSAIANPLGICGQVDSPGALVVCGGGRMREEVYQEFLRLAGGKNARIVHIPSAYPFSSMSAVRNRYSGWLSYDVASFTFLDTDDRDEADTDAFIEPLERATGVWIGGGAQGRLTNLYGGTKTEQALQRVLERGGVIGGTSAGASVMSQTMIRYGTPSEAVTDRGLAFISRAVIDQHFAQRNRLERLLGALEVHRDQIGIGVDEGTALIVQQNRLRVLGSSRVTVCLPASGSDAITLHRLSDGEEAFVALVEDAGWQFRRRMAK